MAFIGMAAAILGVLLGAWAHGPRSVPEPLLHRYERVRLRLLVARPDASDPQARPLYRRLMEAARLASEDQESSARAILIAIEDHLSGAETHRPSSAAEPPREQAEKEHRDGHETDDEIGAGPRAEPRGRR